MRIEAGQQDTLGVNGADVLQSEPNDATAEAEPPSSSSPSSALPPREEPPDEAAGVDRNANVSSGAENIMRGNRANSATSKEPTSRKPPLVARSLDSVRGSLIRQEETIIFALIEREQFRCNTAIYTERTFRVNRSDAADIYGRDASFLEYMLSETEKLHATGAFVCA